MERAALYVNSLKTPRIKIVVGGKQHIINFAREAPDESEVLSDMTADALDTPEPTLVASSNSKKRKIADVSISQEETALLLDGMSLEELRAFALDAHERLVISEKRFEELQTQMQTQNARLDSIEETLKARPAVEPATNEQTTSQDGKTATIPKKPTWAEVTLRNVPEHRHAEVINARLALKPKPRVKPLPAKTSAEADSGVRMIYVEGIQRMRLRDLKGHLKSLGFSISKIFSISFIGFAGVEFIVDEDYAPIFCRQIDTRTDATIAEKFNILSSNTRSTVDPQQACKRRLNRIRDRETTPYVVKQLIDRFLNEKGLNTEDSTLDSVNPATHQEQSMDVDAGSDVPTTDQ